jgi:hypothetical protein
MPSWAVVIDYYKNYHCFIYLKMKLIYLHTKFISVDFLVMPHGFAVLLSLGTRAARPEIHLARA